ncbi:MAG TPA: helix-turn-helix domain-containing protein [Mycobacteriales bacterium]|nr:helix-turn-helix domain-containing protein [Mycobacteriales bacterium]
MAPPTGQLVERRPDPRLRPVVAGRYAGWTLRPDRIDRFVVPAHVSVPLVIKIEDSALRPPEFVHGAAARPTPFEGGCAARYVQVDLTPLGAYRILGVPMHQIAGRLVDVSDLIGRREIIDTVRDAPSWAARFTAIDRFLLTRIEIAPPVSDQVAFAWRELIRSGGTAPIRGICRETGWSHKHLITRFREQVGLTPKLAARVIRFQRVLRQLDSGTGWARIANRCGYADQAHLIRDFAEFAGTTPARVRR